MAVNAKATVKITRWSGSQHPTLSNINRLLHKEGLQPYQYSFNPNHRQPPRSHGYHKIFYVVEGALEIIFPDSNERVFLREGDRVEVPRGIRHGMTIGASGAKCLEASVRPSRNP